MKTFVTYLRVSTQAQGNSGLGIEAQRTAVLNCIKAEQGELAAEYLEIESGKNDRRPELTKAIQFCKRTGATLLIARLDRLSRNVRFLFEIKESGIDIKAADTPQLNTLTLGFLAVVAQSERETISSRVKAALVEKVKRDGEWRTGRRKDGSRILDDKATRRSVEIRQQAAETNPDTTRAKALLAAVYGGGKHTTLQAAADMLNEAGFCTPNGRKFQPTTVARLKSKLPVLVTC
jgi:DNA invertase Pin-like site-specific DNA recombinase